MPRLKISENGPHPVDSHVGQKVKARRLMLGMSQDELAQAIGLTFQQVQKYERGTNRISVSRLTEIGAALKVPLDYFLDGTPRLLPGRKLAIKGSGKSAVVDPLQDRDVRDLVKSYMSIKKPALKKQLLKMAKAISKGGQRG